MANKAVISISGGMDSTMLLMYLLANGYDEIRAYSFKYGQKHDVELKKVKKNIKFLKEWGFNVTHQTIDLTDCFSDSASSLHVGGPEIPEGLYNQSNMMSTVIENRNVIFSSIIFGKALGWANSSGNQVDITLGTHSGDHCFTKDTQIITPEGYKTIGDLKIGDEIYSWKDGKIEIDHVSDLINVGKADCIYNINTSTGNIKTTSDHKFYRVKFTDFDISKGYLKELEEVYAKDVQIGDYLVTTRKLPTTDSEIDEKIDLSQFATNDFTIADDSVYIKSTNQTPRFVNISRIVELMAWYITEGWSNTPSNPQQSRYNCSFSQSLYANIENCETIEEMYAESKLPVRRHATKKDKFGFPREVTYYMSGILSCMCRTAGYRASEKHIPTWLFDILVKSSKLRQIFIRTMVAGDGHYDKVSGLYTYSSISEQLIEDFSFIVKLEGYYVKTYKSKYNDSCIIICFGNLIRKQGLVNFHDGAITKVTDISIEDGEDVFDITVENNHNFFAGKYGNILVHNCIYRDCTEESHQAAQHLFKISNWNSEKVDYIAPFNTIDKGGVLKAGLESMEKLGFSRSDMKKVLKNTHTCYNPDSEGRSCGKCGSCTERLEAFEYVRSIKHWKWLKEDPIKYQ